MNPKPFAIMRDHIDQITNWHQYDRNVDEAYPDRSSAGISFDECFLAVIEDEPPALAAIGSQFNFLTSNRKKLLVSHLFAYEKMELLHTFLSENFSEKFVFLNKRTSLEMLTQLWRLTLEIFLRAARENKFLLYCQVDGFRRLFTPPRLRRGIFTWGAQLN